MAKARCRAACSGAPSQAISFTTTANADNPFAVAVGATSGGRRAGKSSYVLCHQPKSLDWRARAASLHPMERIADEPFVQVCEVLDQILALSRP